MFFVDKIIRNFTKPTPILTVNTTANSLDETYTLDKIAKGRYFYMIRFASEEIMKTVFEDKWGNLEAKEIQLFTIQ